MLGSQPCKASGWKGAVELTTFTGIDEKRIICDVGNSDVTHFVRVNDYRTYATRIKCTGQITSRPRFIKFESVDMSVTEEKWEAECVLDNNKEHTFSHVTVSSKQLGTGDQIIRVTLEIERLGRGIKEVASLQITVSS